LSTLRTFGSKRASLLNNEFTDNISNISTELNKYELKNRLKTVKKSTLYKPKSVNQALYVNQLSDSSIPIVLGIGPAGSGKTLFACNQAVISLTTNVVSKIILTRPIVTVEEELGFLPGSLLHKMNPWTRPMFDILLEFYTQKEIDSMIREGIIEISPLAFMRGRTFKNAFIIADEMQNSSPSQMLMMTTRLGDNSKMVITGDLMQSDRGNPNGLSDFIQKYNAYCSETNTTLPDIRLVEMYNSDIQRSPIVSKLLEIYKESSIEKAAKRSIKKIIECDAALIPIQHMTKYTSLL
jgi:phosphate starvation-inducible PhoH-like protein